ncbi:MAG: hypothetical protein LUQ71_05765 [Methanoregula sp.]|nr:hypothetical protein [Methanoregula sp.]
MAGMDNGGGIYFSLGELGLILLLSVLAALTGAIIPSLLFPEGKISDFVYTTLGLPGPGAGVFVFGSILCFWLLTGLVLVKKPGTAVAMSVVIIAFDLLLGTQVVLVQTMDVLLFVALIIEAACIFPVERGPGKNILPVILALSGTTTIITALIGQAKLGEADSVVTGFPWSYYLFGILGICSAYFCYRYPVRYLVAAGLANMYYMLHFWFFWGEEFASRFPPDPMVIPVLLLIAAIGGVIAASAAYGIDRLFNHITSSSNVLLQDQ